MGKILLAGLGVLAIAYFAFALLAILPAPTYHAWRWSVLATEWGYWFALAGIIIGWISLRASRWLAIPFAVGALLLLTPLFRARDVNVLQLVRGVPGSPAHVNTLMYRDSLAVDVYQPRMRNVRNHQLVVVVHGGAWRGGNEKEGARLNHFLAGRGYSVAAIAYRLAPQHPFPAAINDVHAAVDFLANHLKPASIYLLGRSAGGQLALLTAYTSRDARIKGVISYYGVSDMRWGWDHPSNPRVLPSREILRQYLGGTPQSHGPVYDAASPINFVATSRPTLLIHGSKDEMVSEQQSRRLAERLSAAGKSVEYLNLPWATHGCDFAFNGPCGQAATKAVLRFLESHP